MAARTVLLDTSFIIALEERRDPHHERAKALDRELLEQDAVLVLHWGIILEIGDAMPGWHGARKGFDCSIASQLSRVIGLSPSLSDC